MPIQEIIKDGSVVGYTDIRDASTSKIITTVYDENLTFVDSGSGYITSLSKTSNMEEFISFTCNIEGFSETESISLEEFELQSTLQYKL